MLTKPFILIELLHYSAEVAELADALRSGRSGQYAHVGSNPTFGIANTLRRQGFFFMMPDFYGMILICPN
jgi:hypothetical protein